MMTSFLATCMVLFSFNVSFFSVYAQQGGSSTSGDATGGAANAGGIVCVEGAYCTIYNSPQATGGEAASGAATGGAATSDSSTNDYYSTNDDSSTNDMNWVQVPDPFSDPSPSPDQIQEVSEEKRQMLNKIWAEIQSQK